MKQEIPQTLHPVVVEVEMLFKEHGSQWYGGENVSQLEHALQAATLAERACAPATLIVAALLHDVGHLLHSLPEETFSLGIDDLHEIRGQKWLSSRFPLAVVAPVQLHVAAKRYLCTIEPDYHSILSPSSVQSQEIQGGLMLEGERLEFERQPYFQEAVRLRRWDDASKVANFVTPPIEHFCVVIESVAL